MNQPSVITTENSPSKFQNCDFAVPDSSTEMAEAQEPQATGSAQDTETVLWQIEISPDAGQPDRLARNILADAKDLGISASLSLSASRGFLVQGPLD